MNQTKRTWDLITDEQRKKAIDEIIAHFLDERDEEIGVVAAGEFLDFFLRLIGENIQRTTMDMSKKWFTEQLENLSVDFDMLQSK